MFFIHDDPGDCIVCGAAHCACGPGGPVLITLLPERDRRAAEARAKAAAEAAVVPPVETFTTATYRRKDRRR